MTNLIPHYECIGCTNDDDKYNDRFTPANILRWWNGKYLDWDKNPGELEPGWYCHNCLDFCADGIIEAEFYGLVEKANTGITLAEFLRKQEKLSND